MTECIYQCIIISIKLSLLSLYNRLFPLPWIRKLSIWVAVFVIISNIVPIFADIFACVPIKARWDPINNAKCIDSTAEIIAMSAMNVISDVIILILPMRPVWGLQISRSQKWQLSAMIFLGGV